MAEHTPGPWAVRDDFPYSVDGALIYSTAAGGPYGETICRIDNKRWPRAAENMALLAAAPDLLHACRGALINVDCLVDAARECGEDVGPNVRHLREVLSDAIAKATAGV